MTTVTHPHKDIDLSKYSTAELAVFQKDAEANMKAWKALNEKYKAQMVLNETANTKIGTNRVAIGGGEAVKIVRKETWNVTGTNKQFDEVESLLGEDIFDLLFTAKWQMSKTVYNGLDDKQKLIANRVITKTEGKATVAVEVVKT